MMVPSSDQLTVGKVGPALRSGWNRIILCMAGGPGWSTSHMSANERILSDIVDDQRVFIVYFWWKILSPLLWWRSVKHDNPVNVACAPLPPSACNTTILLTIRLAIRLQLFLTFSLSISSQMFFTFLFLDTIVFYTSFFRISFLYLGARVETGSCRAHYLTLSMSLSPPHKRAYSPVFYYFLRS